MRGGLWRVGVRLDVGHHGSAEILEHANVRVAPCMRTQIDRAEGADRIPGRRDERNAEIRDDIELELGAHVLEERMRARVGEHERLLRVHRVLAERPTRGNRAAPRPVVVEPGDADEGLTLRPDEREHRDRDVEQRRDERRQPVEDRAVGRPVEPESVECREARRVV